MKPYGLKLGGNPGCNCGRCRRGWREGATQNTICKTSARQEAKRIMAGWQNDYAVDCKSAYRGLIPLPVSRGHYEYS